MLIVEGESAAQALLTAGYKAVGTVTGAGSTPGDSALRPLLRFGIYLWPDNDEQGEAHMQRIADHLAELGATPKIIRWPGAPPKGDAADFLETQSAKEVEVLLDAAQPAEPQPSEPV